MKFPRVRFDVVLSAAEASKMWHQSIKNVIYLMIYLILFIYLFNVLQVS